MSRKFTIGWIWNVPKRPHVKGLVPKEALLECVGNFKRWGLMGGLQVIDGTHLKGIREPWILLPSLFSLPRHDVTTYSHHDMPSQV